MFPSCIQMVLKFKYGDYIPETGIWRTISVTWSNLDASLEFNWTSYIYVVWGYSCGGLFSHFRHRMYPLCGSCKIMHVIFVPYLKGGELREIMWLGSPCKWTVTQMPMVYHGDNGKHLPSSKVQGNGNWRYIISISYHLIYIFWQYCSWVLFISRLLRRLFHSSFCHFPVIYWLTKDVYMTKQSFIFLQLVTDLDFFFLFSCSQHNSLIFK